VEEVYICWEGIVISLKGGVWQRVWWLEVAWMVGWMEQVED
jgi:hypothetical protein